MIIGFLLSAENFFSERNYEDIETQFCTYIYKSLLLDDDTFVNKNYQNDFYLNIYRESLELIMNDYDKKHFHIDKGNKYYLTVMIHILKLRGELKKVINQFIADYFKTPYFHESS